MINFCSISLAWDFYKLLIAAEEPHFGNSAMMQMRNLLQAFAQVEDVRVWYGPDTYMGRNLAQLFSSMAGMSDEAIARIHPGHTQVHCHLLATRL